jgi:hypothetical protein
MMVKLFALVAALIGISGGAVLAQAPATPAPAPNAAPSDPQAMAKMLHLATHNQLGVLEFCQASGSVGPDVVAIQRKIMTLLPPAQVEGLAAAEESGKKGIVMFGGTQMALTEAAKTQNTTVDAMCKQIGAMLTAQAANLPK